jgi:hypothetical protein
MLSPATLDRLGDLTRLYGRGGQGPYHGPAGPGIVARKRAETNVTPQVQP